MHAIRLHEFGPAGNLRYEEVDDPKPGPGQVRIAVGAAGVHLLDTTIRSGTSGGPMPLPELPAIPGREVAGVVDALGDGVDDRWLGERVVAHLGPASAGYAELAVRDVEAVHVVADGVSDDAAVAMVGTGRTAMAIVEVAELRSDDAVLVTSAAGGLGTLLVQAARHAGATVIGAAGGAAKVEHVRGLGADVAVDYDEPGWTDGLDPVTVVLDGIGGDRGRAALELAAPGGRIVLYGWSSGTPTELTTTDLYERGLTATAAIGPRIFARPGGLRALEEAALTAARDGRLVPTITRFQLADAAAAHTALEGRQTMGKVVLRP